MVGAVFFSTDTVVQFLRFEGHLFLSKKMQNESSTKFNLKTEKNIWWKES